MAPRLLLFSILVVVASRYGVVQGWIVSSTKSSLSFSSHRSLFRSQQSQSFSTASSPSPSSSSFAFALSVAVGGEQGTAATELPDSLQDAAIRAAEATVAYVERLGGGTAARCRIDFDTTVGDETYPLLKTSTEFMQELVTALCLALIPGLQQEKLKQMERLAAAKAELKAMQQQEQHPTTTITSNAEDDDQQGQQQKQLELEQQQQANEEREEELIQIIGRNGRLPDETWGGPEKVRVYFPDEGNAALAKRDWVDKVPSCVEFSACSSGIVPNTDISRDTLVFFFCPQASDSTNVEQILRQTEERAADNLKASIFVNPNLVDMGVTGFGTAGRYLRERLLDRLECTYYLRTLAWGALTRQWPYTYSVYQDDADSPDGYKLIYKTADRLPSNPEVEEIYEVANGLRDGSEGGGGGGFLDQLGDFVNGMMKL